MTFQDVRPRTRTVAPPEAPQVGYSYPPPQVPPIYMFPNFQGGGYPGANYVESPDALRPHGTSPFSHTSSSPASSTNTHSPSPFPPDPADRNPPDININSWFSFLDRDPRSKNDGTSYTLFGPILNDRGFSRVSQLTPEFVKLSELEDWLGVKRGTAILILQYTRKDLAAVTHGHWVFPGDTS